MSRLSENERREMRRDVTCFVAMVAGWLLSEVPGEHYLALRVIGTAVMVAVSVRLLWLSVAAGLLWLSTSTKGHVAHRLTFWGVYGAGTLWLLARDWHLAAKGVGWLVWMLLCVAVDGLLIPLIGAVRAELRKADDL